MPFYNSDTSTQTHHINTQFTVSNNDVFKTLGAHYDIDSILNTVDLYTNRTTALQYGQSPHIGRTISSYQIRQDELYSSLVSTDIFSAVQQQDPAAIEKGSSWVLG